MFLWFVLCFYLSFNLFLICDCFDDEWKAYYSTVHWRRDPYNKTIAKLKVQSLVGFCLRPYFEVCVSLVDHISPFGALSMARRLWSSVTLMHMCALVALCLLLFGSRTGRSALTHGHDNDFGVQMSSCPIECDCHGLTVDCSHRGLTFVPKFIPPEVRRL